MTINAVDENAANGTVVGVDGVGVRRRCDQQHDYSTRWTMTPGGRFAIDGSTGVVTVADGTLLDREAAASHNITVRATSSDGSFNTAGMTINDQRCGRIRCGSGDATPMRTINAVNENAAVGTVGRRDGLRRPMPMPRPTRSPIRCKTTTAAGSRSTASTGMVTVAGAIDREADGASRNITVRATSADGSFTDQVFAININDVDEFDVGAVTDSDAAINAVDENATVGTVVGVTASARRRCHHQRDYIQPAGR